MKFITLAIPILAVTATEHPSAVFGIAIFGIEFLD